MKRRKNGIGVVWCIYVCVCAWCAWCAHKQNGSIILHQKNKTGAGTHLALVRTASRAKKKFRERVPHFQSRFENKLPLLIISNGLF